MYSYAAYVKTICLLCTYTQRIWNNMFPNDLIRHVFKRIRFDQTSYVTYILIIFLLCTHTQPMLYKYVYSKQVHCLRTYISFAERHFSKKHIKKGRLIINDETTSLKFSCTLTPNSYNVLVAKANTVKLHRVYFFE